MICSIGILILYYLSSCIILLGRAMRVDFQFMCMPLRRNLYMWAVTLSTKMSTVIRSLNTSILVSLIGSFCILQCVLVCLTLPKFFAFTFVYISKALWLQIIHSCCFLCHAWLQLLYKLQSNTSPCNKYGDCNSASLYLLSGWIWSEELISFSKF